MSETTDKGYDKVTETADAGPEATDPRLRGFGQAPAGPPPEEQRKAQAEARRAVRVRDESVARAANSFAQLCDAVTRFVEVRADSRDKSES